MADKKIDFSGSFITYLFLQAFLTNLQKEVGWDNF